MSLERKPVGRPAPDPAASRTLKPAVNPALRLQELLRREAQTARETHSPPAVEEAPSPAAPMPLLLRSAPDYDAPPAPPAPPVAPETQGPVLLVVLVNSERRTPVEYGSPEAMPTAEDLQTTHQAYLLSDEWHRRGAVLVRTVRLRRRHR